MALTRDFKETVRDRVACDPSFREEYCKEGIHLKMPCSNWPEIAIPMQKISLTTKRALVIQNRSWKEVVTQQQKINIRLGPIGFQMRMGRLLGRP